MTSEGPTEIPSVLIVDDDELDRMSVRRALRHAGIAVNCEDAESAERALVALERARFCCAFVDLRMPGRDGRWFLERCRGAGHEVPIVVMTGHGDEEVAVEVMKAGATDYLPKANATPERIARTFAAAMRVHEANLSARKARADLARSVVRLGALGDASIAAHATCEVPGILAVIAERARDIFDAARADVLLIDDAGIVRLRAPVRPIPTPAVALSPAARAAVRGLTTPVRVSADELADMEELVSLVRDTLVEMPRREWVGTRIPHPEPGASLLLQIVDPRDPLSADADLALIGQLARITTTALQNAHLLQAAREAARARDDVLAVVSHDLRGPLQVIVLTAVALLRRLPEELHSARASIERLHRTAEHMTSLVNDLLDAARIQAGSLTLTLESMSPGEVAREVVDSFAVVAHAREQSLELEVDDHVADIRADRQRIFQVLSNLLGNALKFTPARGRIAVSVAPTPEGVRFTVADTGIGIAPTDLPRLFDRYWQARDGSRDGAGLGLYICKGIVDAHGGEISVSSTVDQGSTFSFSLHRAAERLLA